MKTQAENVERTGDSVSIIIAAKELLAKVSKGKNQLVITLNEYEVANRSCQDKLAREELTSLAVLREYERVRPGLQQLKTKKELYSSSTQDFVLKSVSNVVRGSPTKH